jgi:hypothetical protein
MAAVRVALAKQEEMLEAVEEAEEVIAHRVDRREVSVVLLARGRVTGLMAVTPVGLTPRAVQMVVLLAVGDKVAQERAAVDQPAPVPDAQVLPVQETRNGRFAAMIDGTPEVIAKRVEAGRIAEMTREIRCEEQTDGEMTAVPVPETTVGVTATVVVGVLEADKVEVGEDSVVHRDPRGRNRRAKSSGRPAKNVKRVSHETKRNAGPLRCGHVEAAQRA